MKQSDATWPAPSGSGRGGWRPVAPAAAVDADGEQDEAAGAEGAPEDAAAEGRAPAGGCDAGSGDVGSALLTAPDDVLRRRPDRQVLVVGDGIVGRTLTALLQESGYEPVVTPSPGQPPERAVVHLGPAALDAFAHLGLARHVRAAGTRIDAVRVTRSSTADAASTGDAASTESTSAAGFVVDASELRRLLAAEWPLERAQTDRPIARVASESDGVDVEFVDGVSESFDVVVDTVGTPALQQPADAPPTRTFSQYVRRCDVDGAAPQELVDVWAAGALVQVTPGTDATTGCLRVTTDRSDATGVAAAAAIDDARGVDAAAVADALRDVRPSRVTQVQLGASRLTRANWGRGRVARCGEAASPVAPATGCGVTLGVRDAVAFVAALASHDRSTTAAVAAYATGRERAFAAIQRRTTASEKPSGRASNRVADGALGALDDFRAAALEHVLDAPADDP
ncbi:hypothetical protein [Halorubellus sp. PRR65]|uniref:FAD-dependent oxidoreductase n=1 Tax=Halorubellus sp. PRR65 TaxID=3098148 RepID=UPI002B261775|nr:hypothetical protein [Halorubellus sp. PRR65]